MSVKHTNTDCLIVHSACDKITHTQIHGIIREIILVDNLKVGWTVWYIVDTICSNDILSLLLSHAVA